MRRVAVGILNGALFAGAMASMVSCGGPAPKPNVFSDDTGEAITGMKRAARERDLSVAPELIKDLDSDDPAIRFYAIEALQRMTQQDLGYEYFQDEDARKPAVERWKKWLEAGGAKSADAGKKVAG